MTSRIGGTVTNQRLWCNEELEDFSLEPPCENDNDQHMEPSSSDSESEPSSPYKENNPSKISPKKFPLGLNLNKRITPVGRNADIARLARMSAFLDTTMGICREKAHDTFNKGIAALNEAEAEKAAEYAQRSNDYVDQFRVARENIANVQGRIFGGLEVVPTPKYRRS
jgi:hypothetical protein